MSLISLIDAVAPEDVRHIAQKYIRNLRFVVIGNPSKVDKNIFTVQTSE